MHHTQNVFGQTETKRPLARWTIGSTNKYGYECLLESIKAFTSFYDVDVIICHNCEADNLHNNQATISGQFPLFDQRIWASQQSVPPKGVAWKLYPSRLDINRHEVQIDNDIILTDRVEEIDQFFSSDCTLLLEESSRTYGQFEKYVPPNYCINSGIFGLPPGFDLQKYVDFYVHSWEKNALGEHDKNETFDEQGLVAFALLSYRKYVIIPQSSITNCEHELKQGKGCHFVGLNRRNHHRPYQLFRWDNKKSYL